MVTLVLSTLLSFKLKNNDNPKTFKFLNSDTKYSVEFCEKAISEANWCGFRFENKRNLIQFETGLKVELFSQNEIGENNPNCTLTNYRDFSTDVWKFTESGKIVHLVKKRPLKEEIIPIENKKSTGTVKKIQIK